MQEVSGIKSYPGTVGSGQALCRVTQRRDTILGTKMEASVCRNSINISFFCIEVFRLITNLMRGQFVESLADVDSRLEAG